MLHSDTHRSCQYPTTSNPNPALESTSPKHIKNMLLWLWRTSRGLRLKTIVNTGIGLTMVGLDFAFIWATKMAIDAATGQGAHSLLMACVLLIVLSLGRIAMAFARKWSNALLGVKSQNRMQRRTFSRLMHSVWTGKEQFHSGDVMNRLVRDAAEITTVITDTLPAALCVTVRVAVAFMYLCYFDARLAILVIASAPLFILLSRLYIRTMRRLTRDMRNTDSRIQSLLQESLQHRMVLKTLEQSDGMVKRLTEEQDRLYGQVKRRTTFSAFNELCLNFGFTAGYMLTFIWGVYRLDAGTITYGTMIAFIQLVGQIQGPFREMTRFVPAIIGALTSTERMMQLEDTPMEEEGMPMAFPHGAGIRLTNVAYTYADGHRSILGGLSYDFAPGSATAILGETGAGKTTLIRLILALLKPCHGTVELYDENTCVKASPSTRCNLVYVPQGNTLLCGSIRYNLLLGNPDATPQEMEDVLRTACADFVFSLPHSIDSECGEGGSGLSEGQAQRIAIARALLRHGNILLLDEATSALDVETEQRLIRNISARAKERRQTVLFITHRPSVLDYCENILRLDRREK